ncbi:hypothetical protein K9N68_07685 [Kovacikia minuta CCNUW1]|uniref:DUF6883 domain-containing protein n=1 Tax=Kovacikia minuta TaxID=2931930 RepID=UPI001CCCD729|nr:DUF6883 domain-containing protein [Kovacikia minuta]UBF27785.1 hypothetical protein K9N68_07685 [Kovacikia minuta CCNUW1]
MSWSFGQSLPNAQNAEIDPRKFEEYSMNPDNPANQGKWMAFEAIGYDVRDIGNRRIAAGNVISQLRQKLTEVSAFQRQPSIYGLRFEVQVVIQGPNGKVGNLLTIWQIDNGAETPRLITNWLTVYR